MPDWPVVLTVLIAVVVLGGLLGLAAWWYLPPVDLPGSGGARRQLASEAGMVVIPTAGADGRLYPLEMSPEAVPWAGESSSDDDWAVELHAINLAVSHKVWSWFQQKMVPVSEVTHYEVEALIRTLAVPEWVPGRYRMAA